MGFRAATAQIIEQVRLVSPRTGSAAFVCEADGSGPTMPLEKMAAAGTARTRIFDLRLTAAPSDDGAAAVSALRFRAGLAVRVYYAAGDYSDRMELETVIAEDAGDIIARLADANNWDAAANEIDSLVVARSQPIAERFADGAGLILSIPMDLIYHE